MWRACAPHGRTLLGFYGDGVFTHATLLMMMVMMMVMMMFMLLSLMMMALLMMLAMMVMMLLMRKLRIMLLVMRMLSMMRGPAEAQRQLQVKTFPRLRGPGRAINGVLGSGGTKTTEYR